MINKLLNDWTRVKNHCRTTVGKNFTENEPGSEFKKKLLLSEHSPIRLLQVDWSWKGIKSWVATHWTRHKWECFVSTQRDDRTTTVNKTHKSRDKAPQDTPVNFDGYANAQHLIDTFRKRLCFCASAETRKLAEDLKIELHKLEPEWADVLVPNCLYRCGCPEFNTCGYWKKFIKDHPEVDITDIQKRYDAYNKYFYEKHV